MKTKEGASKSKRARISSVIATIILIAGVIIIMIPLLWTICMALKPNGEIYTDNFFPRHIAWDNFYKAVTSIDFFQYLLNTCKILVPVMIGTVLSSAIVAYGFSRFNFKGKRVWFLILLATMMLPGQVTMIPCYLIFRKLGWVNTILPLVIPSFFGGGAFNIFLLRQYMSGIPKDFDEAARIDGAGPVKIFRM